MAGLLSDTVKRSADGVPAMRELPILGALFGSRDFSRSQTELVIIVTPYLVKAADRARLAGIPDVPAPDSLGSAWNTRIVRRPPGSAALPVSSPAEPRK